MGPRGERPAEWFERPETALLDGVLSGYRHAGDDDALASERAGGAPYDTDGAAHHLDVQLRFGPIGLGHARTGVALGDAEARR